MSTGDCSAEAAVRNVDCLFSRALAFDLIGRVLCAQKYALGQKKVALNMENTERNVQKHSLRILYKQSRKMHCDTNYIDFGFGILFSQDML